MQIPFVDLKTQFKQIHVAVDEALDRVLQTTNFIMGEDVARFESEFSHYCGVRHGVGCSSGTAALHLALLGCGVGPGDEVVTSPHTFIATTEAISQAGARVVFADIDERTYTLSPKSVEQVITEKTRAIIPVHIYGQCADMSPILAIAKKYKLKVIEDAAQAHGATYRGRKAGSMGDVACFSFYPGKNLGAYGDAGMVVTNDEEMAENMRVLSNHGRRDKYEHFVEGYNYRLDTLQASILRAKLPCLQTWNSNRKAIACRYNEGFAGLPLGIPYEREAEGHVYHLYVITTSQREALKAHLAMRGISTGIHYPIPLHLQKAYSRLGYSEGDFSITEKSSREVLSLPIFPEMTEKQTEYVIAVAREFFQSEGGGY